MSRKKIKDPNETTVVDKKNLQNAFDHFTGDSLTIYFAVLHGAEVDFGKHFNFTKSPIFIGRDKTNSICLKDEKVSKFHCEINMAWNQDSGQVIIKDLNSTNGTYINGGIIKHAVLKSGDKIGVGDTVFRVSYNDEIEEEYHSKLFSFAAIDALTGLYNRRYILNELENQSKIARRNKRVFSLIVIDIDNFKKINDDHGHLAGDEYLKKMALVVNRCLREQDICGRYGGEEFLIILPETRLDGAFKLANRIREQIEETEIIQTGSFIKATISAGISQFGLHAYDSQSLFEKADMALQKAKNTGKNRVTVADGALEI